MYKRQAYLSALKNYNESLSKLTAITPSTQLKNIYDRLVTYGIEPTSEYNEIFLAHTVQMCSAKNTLFDAIVKLRNLNDEAQTVAGIVLAKYLLSSQNYVDFSILFATLGTEYHRTNPIMIAITSILHHNS